MTWTITLYCFHLNIDWRCLMWFENIKDIDELRQKYKELLIKYHPDNNPDNDTTKAMQSINSEYDNLIRTLKGVIMENTTSDYSEDELKRILNELVKLKVNITIELIGHWIWVYGPDTKIIKKYLKELGFRWAPRKGKWHWGTSNHKVTKAMDMEFIRLKYGSTIYTTSKEEQKILR